MAAGPITRLIALLSIFYTTFDLCLSFLIYKKNPESVKSFMDSTKTVKIGNMDLPVWAVPLAAAVILMLFFRMLI